MSPAALLPNGVSFDTRSLTVLDGASVDIMYLRGPPGGVMFSSLGAPGPVHFSASDGLSLHGAESAHGNDGIPFSTFDADASTKASMAR
jgi:hypothetical protein